MEFKPKNREWVKNAAIVFLAVLLVLTFFSNTIMNRSLPEVATAGVTDGSIVAKVRGTGTVKANGSHNVKTTQTREIRSVMVKVGQEVKTGDTLFVLGAGDSQELETAKETLRDLQYAYQKSAVNMPNFSYTSENRALSDAEKAMNDAEKVLLDANKVYEEMKVKYSDPEAEEQLDSAKEAMQKSYNDLVNIQASYDSAYLGLNAKVVDWQNRVNQLSGYTSVKPSTPDQSQDENQNGTQGQGGSDEKSENSGIDSSTVLDDSVQGQTPGQGDATTAQTMANRPRRSGGIVLLAAIDDIPDIILSGSYQEGETTPNDVYDEQTAKQWLSGAQSAVNEFVSSNKSTLENAKAVYDSAKAKYDAILKYNEQVNYQLIPYREALDKAQAEYDTAANSYEDAWAALTYKQSQDGKTLTSASIDLQQQAEKIKAAQEKVKQLSGDAGDQITANVNGVVTAINVSAGDTVTKDTVVCTIEVPDMGHTLSFSVTNDQAQRLRVGDTATVSNYYWGNEIVATLSNIRTDPKNPQTNKELTFELSGDVTSGSELTISVGQKSANYDTIVPNSAIRSDNNGKFVLAIQAKSSPLGNRYIAKRVSVEVLASDDNNSAVVADLSYGDYVITTSNSPVKSGDQVRMAENNT